jgi:hypothetical protein
MRKKPYKNAFLKNMLSREQLNELSYRDLIEKRFELESHLKQITGEILVRNMTKEIQ